MNVNVWTGEPDPAACMECGEDCHPADALCPPCGDLWAAWFDDGGRGV